MGTINGRPYSQTGFSCYTCHGRGWVIRRKRGVRKAMMEQRAREMGLA
jgi:hypothetical protein